MAQIPAILEQPHDFDPTAEFEAFLRQAPTKWVVYLFCDEHDTPIQLLCVKNLRYSLKRRLGADGESPALSRRVNYRDVVRRVYWRRVDSAFEADWIYYEVARVVFPESYRGMVGFRPAWFIHVNPQTQFPRYLKTIDIVARTGVLIGPLEDKHASARLIESIEDAFDLCRYYHILVQAPNALACAYKEMGKCPAPCDGSISMDQYHRMIDLSQRTVVDPAEFIREQTARMTSAAAELRFEIAAKIKAYIDQIMKMSKGPFRHLGRLSDFAYLSLQQGPRPEGGTAKVFLITPGRIDQILGLTGEPKPAEVMKTALALAEARHGEALDLAGAERVGIVTHHLFSSKSGHGIFIRLSSLDERAVIRAYRELKKQPPPPEDAENEGVLKELQAM